MRIAVTGASGFIGYAVAERLISLGHTVAGFVSSATSELPERVERVALPRPWSTDAVEGAFREHGTEALIHAVGGPRADLATLYADNVVVQEHVLEALERAAPEAPTVIVGSAAEYGRPAREGMCCEADVARPTSAYGIAKLAQTHHAFVRGERGQDVRVGRVFNPVGVRMGSGLAFGAFAHRLAAGHSVLRTGDLNGQRDFFPVNEAARILIELLMHPRASGLVVNVCSGVASPVRDGVQHLLDLEHAQRGVPIVVESAESDPDAEPIVFGSTERLESLGIERAASVIEDDLRALHRKALSEAVAA